MKLSVVIPAYNEEGSICETLDTLHKTLQENRIDHEIFVVNDNSKDKTEDLLIQLQNSIPTIKYESNKGPNGFGYAVRYGLERYAGDCVAVMMADLSDSPNDLIRYYKTMIEGNYDCVFGSRFIKGGVLINYPLTKKIINRIANNTIRFVMHIKYNDTTNGFKLYKRHTIEGIKPFLSSHFNLSLELSLKAIIRGYSYTVLPNSYTNRKYGVSKFKIIKVAAGYFFIFMYCFVEKYFSHKNFKK